MELIHTLGIAIDSSAAKVGSAQAAGAMQQVIQAARAMEGSTQQATKGVSVFSTALGHLRGVLPTIKTTLGQFKDALPSLGTVFGQVKSTAKSAFDGLKGIIAGAAGPAGAAFGALKGVLSSIDFGGLVNGLYETSNSLGQMQRQLEAASTDSADFRENFDFVRGAAENLGLELASTGETFAKFAAAAKGKLSGNEIRDTFLSVAEASTAMGLGAKDTAGVLETLGDMLRKGAVKADDLRDQLDSKLPGAFRLSAEAMGVTEEELGSMLETGEVMAGDLLPKLAKKLHETMGPGAAEGAKSLQSEMNRLKNTWTEIQAVIMGEGGDSLFSGALRYAREALETFKSWLAALFEASKEGRLGEAIAASLQVGIAKAANYFAGFVKTAAQMMAEVGPKVFSADFAQALLETFGAIAASFGLALLKAMERPLVYLQAGMELAIEKFMPKSAARLEEEGVIIQNLIKTDGRFKNRSYSDLGIQSNLVSGENRYRLELAGWGRTDSVLKEAVEKKLGLTVDERVQQKTAEGGLRIGFSEGKTIDEWSRINKDNLTSSMSRLVNHVVDITQSVIAIGKGLEPLNVVDASSSIQFLKELFQNSKNKWSKPAPALTPFAAPLFSLARSPKTPSPSESPAEPVPEPPTPSLFSRFREGLQQGTEGFTDAAKQMQAAGAETARALTSDFADFFISAVEGTKSLGSAFRDMASSILRDIERILVHKMIAEPIVGAITGALGLPTTKSHHGGLVGTTGGMSTLVNPLLFLGAPRLHHGLAPDEFPAILQRGERVVPKSQAGAWERGGGAININVSVDGSKGGTPAQNKAFGAEVARQIEAMVDARIARAAMPRGILRPAAAYA